jgi:hypothetical protein
MLYATAGPLWLRYKKKDYTMKIIKTIKETNCITGDVTLIYTVEDHTEMYAVITGDAVQDAAGMRDVDAVAELEAALIAECQARV